MKFFEEKARRYNMIAWRYFPPPSNLKDNKFGRLKSRPIDLAACPPPGAQDPTCRKLKFGRNLKIFNFQDKKTLIQKYLSRRKLKFSSSFFQDSNFQDLSHFF